MIDSDDLEEAFQNSLLESRIEDLESLTFSQEQNDANSDKIRDLDSILLNHEERMDELEGATFNEEYTESRIKTLDSRVKTLEDSLHETRIIDLENYGFQRESKIRDLEQENLELKERLLHIENFLLKTLKGFKDD